MRGLMSPSFSHTLHTRSRAHTHTHTHSIRTHLQTSDTVHTAMQIVQPYHCCPRAVQRMVWTRHHSRSRLYWMVPRGAVSKFSSLKAALKMTSPLAYQYLGYFFAVIHGIAFHNDSSNKNRTTDNKRSLLGQVKDLERTPPGSPGSYTTGMTSSDHACPASHAS